VKTVTNKWLLIFEGHGDSNWCTPYRRKPNQHAIHFSCSVHVWSSIIHILCSPHITIFHESSIGVGWMHCSRLHLSAQLSGLWDPPKFLLQHNHWTSVLKPSTSWQCATRLIGHISPAYDRYVQYLLVGGNPSVLNRHRQWLKPWRCWLATSHSPTFLTDSPPLST
jgi:hypothetical protein